MEELEECANGWARAKRKKTGEPCELPVMCQKLLLETEADLHSNRAGKLVGNWFAVGAVEDDPVGIEE